MSHHTTCPRLIAIRFFFSLLFVAYGAVAYAASPVDAADTLAPGIEQVYRIDRLAEFRESVHVGSVSSYDRSGGNNDGFDGRYSFVRKEKEGLVLADLPGPGVIYRISTPTPTDDLLEFYFDGEPQPRIQVPFRDLFLGKHPAFPQPLVGYGAGGFYCYVPVTYAKSCKVLIRAERVQFYQINYATYAAGCPIESSRAQPSAEQQEHLAKARQLFDLSGQDISAQVAPAGHQAQRIATQVTLRPGQAATVLDVQRPGRIVGLRFSPASAFAGKDRAVVLRAYWDGDDQPAIVCPAGDFFGYAWGEPAMQSLLLGTNAAGNYCYFPMPFERSARIELYCDPELPGQTTVAAEVRLAAVGRRPNEGRFYTLWRRENPTTVGQPFTFIQTQGRGHLVGFVQQAQGFESGQTPFFEGDDQTTIDGQLVIHGTGSEDFYNGGWYDVPGRWEARRSLVLSGCLDYRKHLARSGGYRILLGDAYAFRQSVLQTIEHAPTGNDLPTDYCGTTYFYCDQRPTCRFELPPAAARAVADPERIVFATWWNVPIHAFSLRAATLTKKSAGQFDGREVRCLSMQADGDDMFGPPMISFACDLPAAGTYQVSLDVVKGPSQGKVQLYMDEAAIGPELDLYAPAAAPARDLQVGTLRLQEGSNQLLFKIVGKHSDSTGLGFDVTNLICQRVD